MTATTLARKPRRVRDAQESRRLLVEAAAQIFNSDGFHGTDTNRIAKAAGYTPGTFYTHFPDKRAIFLEDYRTWVDSELIDIAAGFKFKGPTIESVWREPSSNITRGGRRSAQACAPFTRSIRKSGLPAWLKGRVRSTPLP